MKTKELILFFLLLLSGNVISQVSHDNTFSSDSQSSVTDGLYFTCYLPDYGYVIYYIEGADPMSPDPDQLYIYSLSDYTLIKTIALSKSMRLHLNQENPKFNFQLSQYIFNDDAKIEFIGIDWDLNKWVVYNEDMQLVQELHEYGSSEGVEWKLINLSDDDASPNYKIMVADNQNCYVYSVSGNPFESKSATPIPNAPQLKSSTSLFTVTSNGTDGMFIANIIAESAGKILVTKTNGQLVQQTDVRLNSKSLPINLQSQSRSIYLITYITADGNKQTIKVVR